MERSQSIVGSERRPCHHTFMQQIFRGLLGAFVLPCVIALNSCAVERTQALRAKEMVRTEQERGLTCSDASACAISSPYADLAAKALTASAPTHPVHYVSLLDRGEDALLLRVHLIRAAKKSIDLQTFIFAQDDAGSLILDELIQAARRGVQVRVLADQLFSLSDAKLLAQLAIAHVNFALKVYNPTFDKATTQPLEFAAGVLCCFLNFNQRMHNKLLLIDETIGITGGRNYENSYYDWDSEYDYHDRDVLVAGPAAAQMRASFDQFWQHPRATELTRLRDIVPRILNTLPITTPYTAPSFHNPERVAALRLQAQDRALIDQRFARLALQVGRVEYFSDPPNKPLHPEYAAARDLTERISLLLKNARSEIIVQTPYLVISKPAQKIFEELHKTHKQMRIVISTNSLAATDAFFVYALSYKYKKLYLKRFGFEIHEFKPFPADAASFVSGYDDLSAAKPVRNNDGTYRRYGRAPLHQAGVRLGIHSKSFVIDGATTLIGSHNFDPRSDAYNTESGFIIYDAAFAQLVRASILRDAQPQNSWVIARRPRPKWIAGLNGLIGDFSTALPLFDLWPFRYATSYELNPGCTALPPNDPDFYSCHTAVGDFPEVELPLKTIYTRIATAFGATLVSIL